MLIIIIDFLRLPWPLWSSRVSQCTSFQFCEFAWPQFWFVCWWRRGALLHCPAYTAPWRGWDHLNLFYERKWLYHDLTLNNIPVTCSFLQEFIVIKSVRVGTILVDYLLQVGKSLPVQFWYTLVPKPIGIIWNMRKSPVPTDLLLKW